MNLTQVAQYLGVSSATIRNWIKTGLIIASKSGRSFVIERDQVISLKNKIDSGEMDRLSKRANKKAST